MATIKDIAKKANVSIATVSYVLNRDPRIKEDTALKVLKVAQELNYVANGGARSLRMNKSMRILVIVANFIGPVYNVILECLSTELTKNGYQMFVCNGANIEKIFSEKNYDGIINYDATIPVDVLLQASNFGYPIIDMTRHIQHSHLRSCVIANFAPIHEIVHIAYKEGIRRIAYMRGNMASYDEQERYAGFLKGMEEVNLTPVCVLRGSFTSESGYDAMKEYFTDNVAFPELMICANDEMAIGCYDFLKKKKVDLVSQMKIIGFDNIQLTKYYVPQISTVDISHIEWTKYVVKMMLACLKGQEIPEYKQFYKIIRRDSF